ncbi:MAG: nuclear transport factor 2 family protein [Actinobacteria bacterium]|nr:nuclear transport factor 2 family protein [Actinomycetota bacterium]
MADRDAIEQLFADYGWPMDTREWPVLSTVFTEDATFTITIAGDEAVSITGRDAIVEFCSSTVNAQTDQRRHVITNIRHANETATSADVYAILTLIVVTDGELEVKSSGLYRTKVVKESDRRWRFAHMLLELDRTF